MINRLIKWAENRKPDLKVGTSGQGWINLTRWHIIPDNRIFNIYLHRMQASADIREKHDHPWVSCSIILRGGYFEHLPKRILSRVAGDIVFRGAKTPHRTELLKGHTCWTIFITGPRFREWGFHCPNGWKHWKEYVNLKSPGDVGRGCGE